MLGRVTATEAQRILAQESVGSLGCSWQIEAGEWTWFCLLIEAAHLSRSPNIVLRAGHDNVFPATWDDISVGIM